MKKLLLCIVMFLSALALYSQPAIQFENTTFDFGTIKEEGGKVIGRFEFTNTGDQDLLISSVKASCGCTATEYTKTPVPPGQRGFIDAAYNPHNRPGPFNKNIRVSTNEPKFMEDENAPAYQIYIKGSVEKRAPSKHELAGYKSGNGDVRIKNNSVNIELLSTETKTFAIQVMNFSENNIATFEPKNLPNFITMDVVKTINPGQEIEINFKYDALKRGEIGSYKDIITIHTQDPADPNLTLFIDATIKEDFSKLTAKQLQDAPKAHLETPSIDFGKVEKNTNPTLEVKLYNNGKNSLHIRQLKSSSTVFSIASNKNEIKKGEFATLTITLNSRNRRGPQNATIDIITNDPENRLFSLNCKGDLSQ